MPTRRLKQPPNACYARESGLSGAKLLSDCCRPKADGRDNVNRCLVATSMRRQDDGMTDEKRKTEIVKVSRLGCMRKSTIEVDSTGSSIEHIEVWTDEPTNKNNRPLKDDESSPRNRG